jgi:hypothetical protein
MIGIFLLQNIDEALTSDHVDPASLRVVEEIVRIGNNFGGRYCLAALGIEDQQARRLAAANKQPMVSFVERHRKTRRCGRSGPSGEYVSLYHVGYFDLFLVWNIHENACPGFLQLKRFGVGVNDDFPGFLPVGIQNP